MSLMPFVWRATNQPDVYELRSHGGAVFLTVEKIGGLGWRAYASPTAKRLAGCTFPEAYDALPSVAATILLADMHPRAINLDEHKIVYEPQTLEALLRL